MSDTSINCSIVVTEETTHINISLFFLGSFLLLCSCGSNGGSLASSSGGSDSGGVDAGAGLKNVFLAFAELAGALTPSDADVHLVLTWLTDI